MGEVKISCSQGPNCETCKLHVTDNTWRPPEDFNYSPKFLFVCDQFTTSGKARLKRLLRACEFDTNDMEVAYLTRCNAGEAVKAQIREGQHCYPLTEKLLAKVDKKTIIVPMGATPCKMIAKQKSILTAHGNAVELDGRVIVPTLHPGQVIAYPDSMPTFMADLVKIADAGEGVFAIKSSVNYTLVDTIAKFKQMIVELWDAPAFSFDIESTSLNAYKKLDWEHKVLCFTFSCKERTAWCLVLDNDESPWTRKQREYILHWTEKLLQRGSADGVTKIPHNGQFDTKYIRKVLGWEVTNDFDTLLAHYIAISEEQGTHGLKVLAWEFTDMGGYDDALDEYKQTHPEADPDRGGHYGNIPLSILWWYACCDADCTFRLYNIFKPRIDEEFSWLFENIVMPSTNALAFVEGTGAPVDIEWLRHCQKVYPDLLNSILDRLREFPEVLKVERILRKRARDKKLQERVDRLKARAEAIDELANTDPIKADKLLLRLEKDIETAKTKPIIVAPIPFNPKSPAQNKLLLFGVLGMTPTKKSKGGGWSTDKEVLKNLYEMDKHPIIQALGQFIKIKTLYSMFVEHLDEKIDADGRIRCSYKVFGTAPGRLSCSDPNLQQIPKNPKEDGFLVGIPLPSIKKLFYALFGFFILQFDYSQAELRVMAALADEPTMREAFANGEDIHKRVASEAYGITQDEVTEQQRHAAKTINFGLIYGQGAAKLAKTIGCSLEEAKEFIRIYFKKLPRVKKWINQTKARVRENGFVMSPYGRKRRLASVFSPEQDIVAKAERQGVNSPIQCTASDCTLQAIVRINHYFLSHNMRSRIIVTVHDSIVNLIWIPEAIKAYRMIKKIMEHPIHSEWLNGIPMAADADVGLNWGELTKVKSEEELLKLVETFPR